MHKGYKSDMATSTAAAVAANAAVGPIGRVLHVLAMPGLACTCSAAGLVALTLACALTFPLACLHAAAGRQAPQGRGPQGRLLQRQSGRDPPARH